MEDLLYDGSSDRVKLHDAIRALPQAQRHRAAVVLSLHSILHLAALDFYRQLGGIVFGQALQQGFQQDALGAVADVLGGRNHLDAVLFQNMLIGRTVIAVTGKAIQLPDEDYIEQMLLAIVDHPLEIGAIRRARGHGAVDVVADNGDAAAFGISHALAHLALNALLALAVRGIAGVNHTSHRLTSNLLHSACSQF